MNKNQLIVAWVMGIWIILISISPLRIRPNIGPPIVDLGRLIAGIIPILIIGSLLIYTLRDKKK